MILSSCAADSTSERAELLASRAEHRSTPELELICNDNCRLVYRRDDTLSVPLDNCSADNELCLWRGDFINLYIPRGDRPSWSFRDRDYKRVPEGKYDKIEERHNGALTKTYFVFEDRAWMFVNSNRHGWTGEDGRGIVDSNAHSDSLLFVIYFWTPRSRSEGKSQDTHDSALRQGKKAGTPTTRQEDNTRSQIKNFSAAPCVVPTSGSRMAGRLCLPSSGMTFFCSSASTKKFLARISPSPYLTAWS